MSLPDHSVTPSKLRNPRDGWPGGVDLIWLAIVLSIASMLRISGLTARTCSLDECWSMEIATGRGSLHQHLPINQIITPAPEFYLLNNAPAWWAIWSHMQVTHPPLYPVLLRWWEFVFTDSDAGCRMFSVTASLVGIVLLFDSVRLQAGAAPAFWASLLMSLATTQIEYSRFARSYTLLTALGLLTINIVTRIQVHGPSRKKLVFLFIAVLGTLLTHYFCVGALLGLVAFTLTNQPRHRRSIVITFIAAGTAFALLWGPWMWQQRHLFATDDPSTLFLTSDSSHLTRNTLLRVLREPFQLMFDLPYFEMNLACVIEMTMGTALIVAALLPSSRQKNPFLMLWVLWYAGCVVSIAVLDLSRSTNHLQFIRYTFIAGPSILALIPFVFASARLPRQFVHIAGILGTFACVVVLSQTHLYDRHEIDPPQLARDLQPMPAAGDLLVFAASPVDLASCQIECLVFARYFPPMNCSVAILTQPATPAILNFARHGHLVFLDTPSPDSTAFFPDAQLVNTLPGRGLGHIFVLSVH